MTSAICTLFEGDYHYGLGALVNSLYKYGYRGIIWAGYRGSLPPWASGLQNKEDYQEYEVAAGCQLRFVALDINTHFTNYKPDFLLQIIERSEAAVNNFFYIDPDICVKCTWHFFEEWVKLGVALCEDVSPLMNRTNPLRLKWRKLGESKGLLWKRDGEVYVNGGFIGVKRDDKKFLVRWQEVQGFVSDYVGGTENWFIGDRTNMFYATDQDALNMTCMFTEMPYSILGKEGMDFVPGGYTMSHALGSSKPWRKKFISSALSGVAPTLADKQYALNLEGPIQLYSRAQLKNIKIRILIAAALGRFINKS